MSITKKLTCPLFTGWSKQYAIVKVEGLQTGSHVQMLCDGKPADFQYTGKGDSNGAEIMLRLAFEPGQSHDLEFVAAESSPTELAEKPVTNDAPFGAHTDAMLQLAPAKPGAMNPPLLASFAGNPLKSSIVCKYALVVRSLSQTCSGPLFIDYLADYQFAEHYFYRIKIRCYKHEPMVEVAEHFFLGLESELVMELNPAGTFDKLLSHRGFDFEGEGQTTEEFINVERPKDVLCRLQMPMISEYVVANNRGWFSFFDSKNEDRGMMGIMALYGDRWESPVDNMIEVLVKGGRSEWHGALGNGRRFWLLYQGPVEREYTPERRLVFHRLHAEFNALRLDEHLDLTGDSIWDSGCWDKPGFFTDGYRERARHNAKHLPPLKMAAEAGESKALQALLEPTPERQQALLDDLMGRFRKWVKQFQGWRENKNDYAKNVIGFSRRLRGLLASYELLRKDGFLTDEQVRELNAYFVFAARRIMDEGRWPHSKTHLHPDHPDSTRDIYTYPGEHKPDKLIWTNCLPNFQSDPLCGLVHISAMIPEHPDALKWQRKALDGLEDQLNAYCGANGAWEESINYALYTLSYFIMTFRVVKNRFGIDYFNDDRMRRYVDWLVRFLGPYDKRFDAVTWPAIGNSVLPQNQGEYLLAYAGELDENDPLRAKLIAAYQKLEPGMKRLAEHSPLLMAEMASVPEQSYDLPTLESEHMPELGVSMRHKHNQPDESYLFQKIGFWKDHYEYDESAFNWYAKGTPLSMEYGTYTGDAGAGGAHNLVEIPDLDALRRGYLAQTQFTPMVDFTRCEIPVTLKLSYGHLRSFEEIDGPPQPPMYHYIGDENPIGPKTWKKRFLLYVKPDYIVIFDRVIGPVPHRYNLHITAEDIARDGQRINATGRFDIDMQCFVQHPVEFDMQTGELSPMQRGRGEREGENPHRQKYFRLYNRKDGIYRTALFAKERGREVQMESVGSCGVKITTPDYQDYIFTSDEIIREDLAEGVSFNGRVGWIRRSASGAIFACMPDGDSIAAFGKKISGRGPWTYNMDGSGSVEIEGVPRRVEVTG